MTAAESMEAGVDFLSGLMQSHGFAYAGTAIGKGSGGAFASGEYRRGDRRLELHFRHSLGLVKYHAGDVELSHEDYMWSVLGERYACHYPRVLRGCDGWLSPPVIGSRTVRFRFPGGLRCGVRQTRGACRGA